MMKKTLSALLALLMLVSLGACSFGENDSEKGKDNASETLDTVKDDVKDQTENQPEDNTESQIDNNTEDLTEDTNQDDTETDSAQNEELISDEEAIALCIAGQKTVHSWGECAVIYDYNSEGKIIREFDDGVSEFTPLKKDDYSILQSPDIRGNTKIYYGDYEWMQENVKKIFTERFIEKHFNGFPWPFIYENGTVYFSEYAGGCSGYQTDINYTVINKTENEFSVVYETYHKDYDTHEILYSEPSYLGYMKFVKEGDLWLIDAYNSTEIIVFIYADDAIPAKFKDKVPEKYRDKSYYFEEEPQASEDEELISDEEAIALCIAGQETVHSWGDCNLSFSPNSEGSITREMGKWGKLEFRPLDKDECSTLSSPDIRGNTKIYYGDYEWMQENLKKIFTERFIEKHFNGLPWPFIYENGTVYFSNYAEGGSGYQTDINYTVINKTENEFSVVYETYHKDYDTDEILYSEPSCLGYMKFVKEGDLWLIDAYKSTQIDVFIYADDAIPTEFKDKVPEKYRDKSYYFEEEPQASEDEELISDEEGKDNSTETIGTKDENTLPDELTTEYNDDVLAQRYKPFSERVDFTPGDGSFFAERSDELAAAADAFLKEYENDKASSPPIMYYLVQKMGLSISEMYDYYCPGVSPDFVDDLFIEDMEEAKRALMADYSFYTDGKVYTFYEVYNAEMAGEPLFDITDSDHAAVLWEIYDYLTFQNKYGQQQQHGEYIPFVEEIITENFTTITDIADWETLGLSKEYSGAYSFLWELLSGESDVPEYNELGIKDYSLTRLFEINSPAETIEFTFTVTGNSLPETLPPGTYTKIVDEGVDVFLYDNKKPVENEEYTEINRVRMGFDKFGDIPAAQAVYWYVDWNYWKLSSYGQWEPERDLLPYGYICKFYGENLKIDFSELQQLMYDKFGIEVERPKESGYLHSKGICVYDKETDTAAYTDTRYFEPHHRIIDVKTENEITYVTVQLFADRLHLVPSHKIVYEIGADEVFLGCEIVEFGKYEPGELDLKSQG